MSVRFHVERRMATMFLRADDVWTRETLAGAKTIADARKDLAQIRRESPKYFKRADFRIVKVTTTRLVVK